MILKGLVEEDFVNYKLPSMFLMFPHCSFKCCMEIGKDICQNSSLAKQGEINAATEVICQRYVDNPITKALVCGGLEPFDSKVDLLHLIDTLRRSYNCHDDIVIYTGYKKEELTEMISILQEYDNIIIKFGRFVPDQQSHYDDVLGIYLASPNQYAEKIS